MDAVKSFGFKRNTSKIEKLVTSKLFWLLFILANFTYPIYRSITRELPAPLPKISQVPEFVFTNEFKKEFGTKELIGRTYIANFIFTNCPSSCLRLTQEMEKIQKRVRGLGNKIALVSFTVDPENDSPEELFKYARKNNANPYIWNFLTGEHEALNRTIVNGFNVPMGEKAPVEGIVDGETVTMMDIAHSEKLVLVDGQGFIRGYYNSDKDSINKMMIDVGLLVNSKENF